MRHVFVALALVSAAIVPSAHARPTVSVTACGQAVPPNAIGLLANDLDCTAFVGGIANEAVSLGHGAKLDLQGFTITGGLFGVGCYEVCPEGPGTGVACSPDGARCEIVNGTVTGAEASGITGDVVTVRNVTASNNGDQGVQGYRKARAFDSTLTGNGVAGIRAWTVQITNTTATGNARFGVAGSKRELSGRVTHGITLRDSTATGNGTAPDCSNLMPCADVSSGTRPKLRRSTCVTSERPSFSGGCGADEWCVCAVP